MKKLSLPKSVSLLLMTFLTISFILSCKKDPNPAPNIPVAVITSISPTHGPSNTVVTIIGSNFSNDINSNQVKFNGQVAIITSASSTQLTVSVPAMAGTGNITLTINGVLTTGPIFTYDYLPVVGTVAVINSATILEYPTGVAIDKQKNIYVADPLSNQIKKIDPAGNISVFAGTGGPGFINGPGISAKFNYPWAVVSDSTGIVYVADLYNHSIRKISNSGTVSTLAGNGTPGYFDGTGSVALFKYPDGITLDDQGNIYVGDRDNYQVRKVTQAGVVTSLHPFLNSPYSSPHGLLVLGDDVYVADTDADRIMKVKLSNPTNWTSYESGLDGPTDIVADKQGNIYVADAVNRQIKKFLPNGSFSVIAGTGVSGYVDGNGSTAQFKNVNGLAIDKDGNIYVADSGNKVIRKISFQ